MVQGWIPRLGICLAIGLGASGCQFMPFGLGQSSEPAPLPKPAPALATRSNSNSALFADPVPKAAHPDEGADASADQQAAQNLAAKVRNYTQDMTPQLATARAGAIQQPAPVLTAAQIVAPKPPEAPAISGSVNFRAFDSMQLTQFPAAPDAIKAVEVVKPVELPAKPVEPPAKPVEPTPAAMTFANADALPRNVPAGLESPSDAIDKPAGDFISHIKRQARDYPASLDAQLDSQLLGYLQGQPVPASGSMNGLSSEDREIASALLDGITNFRDGLRSDGNMLVSKKVQPLLDMADRLRASAELSIPTIALCSRVKSFGDYDPIVGNRIVAGRVNEVILYCEITGFASRLNERNLWQSDFQMDSSLYLETGDAIWSDDTKNHGHIDLCRDRRHDMHMAKIVKLPQNLSLGRYLLKVTITDTQANHIAEATTYVEVVAG